MRLKFDAELIGFNGIRVEVHCEILPPCVGGQAAEIRLEIARQCIVKLPPSNPCTLLGRNGSYSIDLKGVYWRNFPMYAQNKFELKEIKLLHVEELRLHRDSSGDKKEICFHLAPVNCLKSQFHSFDLRAGLEPSELFRLELPNLGSLKFISYWISSYDADSKIPNATSLAGFDAVLDLKNQSQIDIDSAVKNFKGSIEVLSVLFRQAVTLHGWRQTGEETVDTWINSLEPNETPCAHEERGQYVCEPQRFNEYAQLLVDAYGSADKKTRSLVRHILVAANPHNISRTNDRFMFMFSVLERLIEFAFNLDKARKDLATADLTIIGYLEELRASVVSRGGDDAETIDKRLAGFIGLIKRHGFRDKLESLIRVYPLAAHCFSDLWPIQGSEKRRGLKEIRNSLAHGRSSSSSINMVAVAEWHLSILLERMVFIILGIDIPKGIAPNSFLLEMGGKGWYDREWWEPLQMELDEPI